MTLEEEVAEAADNALEKNWGYKSHLFVESAIAGWWDENMLAGLCYLLGYRIKTQTDLFGEAYLGELLQPLGEQLLAEAMG